ncbi:MAG: M14 family zinc carboxypeptidase [Planctomycetota bacterium]
MHLARSHRASPPFFLLFACLSLACGALVAQAPIVSASGENMRLGAMSTSPIAGGWALQLQMQDDNGNTSLPNTWRRWWHCQVANLTPGQTLDVRVTNAGYSDVILPVWSLSTDGVQFGSYERMPTSAVPTVIGGTQHRFSVVVPPGVVACRMAKFFPYTVTQKGAWLATVAGDPRVRSVVSLGSSQQGRAIEKITFTDSSVADTQKQRVWIHAGIHPAETTSFYMVEGLVEWLLSGVPEAEALLDAALVEIVPMANPDGVFVGNYRTNVNSTNLEADWSAPYNSTQPELVALRTAIEGHMGTVANPGSNPIRVLLNLHSTHNVAFPFHFRHVGNANWSPGCSSCGVLPIVNQVETQWVNNFEARSPLVALGNTANSTLGSRPFVESMCHDRWTAVNGWLNSPGFQEPVMAITFEGTYGRGPDQVAWSTDEDYRQVGREMGLALFDQLDVSLGAAATIYGSSCATASLAVGIIPQPDGSSVANLAVSGGPPLGVAVLAVGGAQVSVPFPSPWANCTLVAAPDASTVLLLNGFGIAGLPVSVPALSGLDAYLQAVTLDSNLSLDASNGVRIQNNF